MQTSGLSDPVVLDAAARIWSGDEIGDRIPIWLDCDTGHDDAFAILLCATWPGFNLLGISTVHGNSSLANTTSNSLSILEAIGRRDVPVYAGAAKPFCREAAHAESIHGVSGLDGTTILPKHVANAQVHPLGTITAMYEALSAFPGKACLVATGSLTNVGLLFATHPGLADSIACLSIMGGAVGNFFTNAPMGRLAERPDLKMIGNVYESFPEGLPELDGTDIIADVNRLKDAGLFKDFQNHDETKAQVLLDQARNRFGNWSNYAEFNIYCDPEAASSLFSDKLLASKTTLIPLDLTHQVLATPSVLHLLKHGTQPDQPKPGETSIARFLFHEIITFFAATYAREFGMHDGPPLHDPLAVAAIIAPSLFNDCGGERFDMSVVRAGEVEVAGEMRRKGGDVGECGRTTVKLLKNGQAGVRIPRGLKVDVFWHVLNMALDSVDKSLIRK